MWKKWLNKFVESSKTKDASVYETIDPDRIPQHIAIIMDGNGRWAQKRGMPRTFGHRAGAETLREIVKTASELGVGVLTAYAFSTENWKRPAEEVNLLMSLLADYLDNEIDELHLNNVQVRFIGNEDELAVALRHKIEKAQSKTAGNNGLILNLAVNYGGRSEIIRAVQLIAERIASGEIKPQDIDEKMLSNNLYTAGLPDPDLLIRPSGDLRISNFLLWQLAYTEFWFTEVNWPDFTSQLLVKAITDFQLRERRFGGLKKNK